jgi:hypothetical protein
MALYAFFVVVVVTCVAWDVTAEDAMETLTTVCIFLPAHSPAHLRFLCTLQAGALRP